MQEQVTGIESEAFVEQRSRFRQVLFRLGIESKKDAALHAIALGFCLFVTASLFLSALNIRYFPPFGLEFISLLMYGMALFGLLGNTVWFLLAIACLFYHPYKPSCNHCCQPFVSIIVPAHNEEKVIATITQDLLDQTYSSLEVIVVAHNCTDQTAEVANAFADSRLKVYELTTKEVGKAIPLNFAFGKTRGSIVAQFDADNHILDRRMVEKAVHYFADNSVDAIQGKLETKNPNVNLLTKFQQIEFAVWSYIFWAGKNVINTPSPIAGTNAFFRREAIERVAFWDHELVEDFALYLKLASSKAKIIYAPDVVSSDEKPATWSSLVKQRRRWVRGTFDLIPKWFLKKLPLIDKLYMIIPFWMILWYITTAVCLGSGLLMGQLTFWYLPASVWVGQTVATYSLLYVILRKTRLQALARYLPLYYAYSFSGFLMPFFILRNVNWGNTKTDHG